MLGNETDARFIRDWYIEGRGYGAPEGWRLIGSGCYRNAYLHVESGVVYKVDQSYGYGGQGNNTEARALRNYFYNKKMPAGCRLPRFRFLELDGKGVIAMEKFDKLLKDFSIYGNGAEYYDRRDALQRALRDTYDLHAANLAVDEVNQLLVPIDLGG